MERIVNQQYAELIAEAYSAIPDNIIKMINHVHFFCGTDPIFAGLENDEPINNGASPKVCSHYLPESRQFLPKYLRHPTIILVEKPEYLLPHHIIHELGHVLNRATDWYEYRTPILEVTEYAKTDFEEAFAEAFTSWLIWDYGKMPDPETLTLFNRLAEPQCIRQE